MICLLIVGSVRRTRDEVKFVWYTLDDSFITRTLEHIGRGNFVLLKVALAFDGVGEEEAEDEHGGEKVDDRENDAFLVLGDSELGVALRNFVVSEEARVDKNGKDDVSENNAGEVGEYEEGETEKALKLVEGYQVGVSVEEALLRVAATDADEDRGEQEQETGVDAELEEDEDARSQVSLQDDHPQWEDLFLLIDEKQQPGGEHYDEHGQGDVANGGQGRQPLVPPLQLQSCLQVLAHLKPNLSPDLQAEHVHCQERYVRLQVSKLMV